MQFSRSPEPLWKFRSPPPARVRSLEFTPLRPSALAIDLSSRTNPSRGGPSLKAQSARPNGSTARPAPTIFATCSKNCRFPPKRVLSIVLRWRVMSPRLEGMTFGSALAAPFASLTFEEKLDRLAEVAVRVGLGLRPGQELVLTAPTDALPLVRRIVVQAYKAGAKIVTTLLSDDAVTLARYQHAPDISFDYAPQ